MYILKKIWKVLAFFLIPLVAAVCLYTLSALLAGERMLGIEYTLSDDGSYYTLSDYGAFNLEKEFEVPEEYKGKPVIEVGDEAFRDCVFLESVTVGANVEHIGEGAFGFCERLTSVVIGDSVTSIGDHAFLSCGRLTNVEIGDSVTSIGSVAFVNCYGLERVYISDIASWCNIDFADFASNPSFYGGKLYLEGEIATKLIIPDGVSEIKARAFSNFSNLTSVVIGDSVTSIGDYAFIDCDSLTSIVIGDSVTSIGYCAFDDCFILTDVYYTGSEEEWNAIAIDPRGNEYLLNATIHYNYVSEK